MSQTRTAPNIDIRPDQWEIVHGILQKHVPQYAVWAFGSRAKWTAKEYSDLDLAIITDKPLPLDVSASLRDDFSESDLPWKVDVVDWATTSASFRKIIERDKVVVQEAQRGLDMVNEWRETTIGNIASVQTGPFGSQLHNKDYVLAGTPIVTVEHLGERKMTRQNLPCVSDVDKKRLSKYTLQYGDLVFSRVGSVDRCSWVSEEEEGWMFSGRCLRVRPNNPDEIYHQYLYYFFSLESTKEFVRSIAVGATMPSINTRLLSDVPISYPPIEEQRAIAHILGTLDDKIELNRKQNETLEAMARALFKAWFVDFEPVRAKIEGRWQRGLSLPGLPAHLYDLFPDRLVESELGEIPEGWGVSTVGEYFDLTMGQSPPGDTYNETGVGAPFYQGRTDFGARFPTERIYCSAPTRWAKKGDVLVSVRAPVGDMNVALDDCAIGRGVAAVHHEHASFALYALQSLQPAFKQFESEGTVFGAINKKQFEALQFVAPTDEAVRKFESITQSMDSHIESNEMQSRSLAQLRDTLLPKLISGELRVPDAEAFLKERGL